MTQEQIEQQLEAEVNYMNALTQLALERARDPQQELAYDLQGRVLVEVSTQDVADELKAALGRKVSAITTVSLDLALDNNLNEVFYGRIKGFLTSDKRDAIIDALRQLPKGSIIALQQEYYFHVALTARLYTNLDPRLDSDSIRRETIASMRAVIMRQYANALQAAFEANRLENAEELNKNLDGARARVMTQVHERMRNLVEQRGMRRINSEEWEAIKKTAEATSATANDVLHLNVESGLATFISGSEETAHNRKRGKKFAHRQLITQQLVNGNVDGNIRPRIQIRTPSPVIKEGDLSDEEFVEDAKIKLDVIREEYHLASHLHDKDKPVRAFIYNSYTAIGDRFGDMRGNLQTKSARHILLGAHLHNAEQRAQENSIYCFVQNISVNGFGYALGYEPKSILDQLILWLYPDLKALLRESTLMAEMALVHTLYDTATDDEKDQIGAIMGYYQTYLQSNNPKEGNYFSAHEVGEEAIKALRQLKEGWQHADAAEPDPKLALRRLIAHNLHYDHRYAKLIQTLSVYLEDVSLGGCKSGNERAQAINGRVAILDSWFSNELIEPFGNLVAGKSEEAVHKAAEQLRKALDEQYNQLGLQGAASLISLLDQGAASKIEAKHTYLPDISRNLAEESTMSNLHQAHSGEMQAHKKLIKYMRKAWETRSSNYIMNTNEGAVVTSIPGPNNRPPEIKIESRTPAEHHVSDNAPENQIKGKLTKFIVDGSMPEDDEPIPEITPQPRQTTNFGWWGAALACIGVAALSAIAVFSFGLIPAAIIVSSSLLIIGGLVCYDHFFSSDASSDVEQLGHGEEFASESEDFENVTKEHFVSPVRGKDYKNQTSTSEDVISVYNNGSEDGDFPRSKRDRIPY